jgi:DNA-directed RNA polymerase subunit M/transcription elongation factor TFIIS
MKAAEKYSLVMGADPHRILYEIYGSFCKGISEEEVLSDLKKLVPMCHWKIHEPQIQFEDSQCRKRLEKPQGVVKGMFKCKKCGSDELIPEPKQTRAADEGETLFVECCNCSDRFKIRS